MIRQTKAFPYCAVPATVKPAPSKAARPVAGAPGAQPRSTAPPSAVKSTTTVTPEVDVQELVAALDVAGLPVRASPANVPAPRPRASTAPARCFTIEGLSCRPR